MQQNWPINAEQDQNTFFLPVNISKYAFPLSLFWKPVYNV